MGDRGGPGMHACRDYLSCLETCGLKLVTRPQMCNVCPAGVRQFVLGLITAQSLGYAHQTCSILNIVYVKDMARQWPRKVSHARMPGLSGFSHVNQNRHCQTKFLQQVPRCWLKESS